MRETPLLGWVIIYVPDVRQALDFYARAFGLQPGYVDADATFGQLDTGQTALSFASEERVDREIKGTFQRSNPQLDPYNISVCLVFTDPRQAYHTAVDAGCTPIATPEAKPHGQVSGFVRDIFGNLIEIASPL